MQADGDREQQKRTHGKTGDEGARRATLGGKDALHGEAPFAAMRYSVNSRKQAKLTPGTQATVPPPPRFVVSSVRKRVRNIPLSST